MPTMTHTQFVESDFNLKTFTNAVNESLVPVVFIQPLLPELGPHFKLIVFALVFS